MTAADLTNLLDSLIEFSIYVIEEETHKLLFFNQRCRETSRGRAAVGVKCHEVWPEVCSNCPLDAMGEKSSGHIVCHDPVLKTTVDVTANRVIWDDHIRAVAVTVSPHRMNFEEGQGAGKIQRMYAQSLVTVFDECIIANLTADYYVNCQKDMMWTNIPEHGEFAVENQKYARMVLHPDDLEAFNNYFSSEALLRLFGEGRKQISKRFRRLTGRDTYHMVEFTAARIERANEDECWCVLVFRDIQDEFLLEQKRNVEISQLATAARVAYQMVIAVNLTRNSYHMVEYERYPVKEPGREGCFVDLIEHELSTVHPDYREEFARKFSRRSLTDTFSRGTHIVSMEVPHMGSDGIYHWYFSQVVWVESEDTEDLIEITLSRSIDEDRRRQKEMLEKERKAKELLEDALREAEKASQAKSDFLSKMSHDIRTPMNAIIGMTELAQLHILDSDRMADYLEKISSAGAHLLGLINEVLDVSKIESGVAKLNEKEFDLQDMMQDVVEMVNVSAETRKQILKADIESGIHCRVSGDEERLKQILVNLLENASKYTQDGGKISVRLRELKKNDLQVGTYQFTVEDNGVGMKKEYLEHIYEPFSRADDSRTSKTKGTGLGMTIVKNLVTMMGGSIQVESQYGKGTRFEVIICLNKCDETKGRERESQQEILTSLAGIRVLLVEDNEINRQIAAEMIELLGAETEWAENGKAAVEAVCSHPPHYYDIVFMDIQMPVMNGYDAARAIRDSGMKDIEDLPIIAMTADAFNEDVKRARRAGMNGHIAKPISIDQIKNILISLKPVRPR